MRKWFTTLALFLALLAGILSSCVGDPAAEPAPSPEAATTPPPSSDPPPESPEPSPLPTLAEETDPYGNPLDWGLEPGNFPLYAMLPDDDIYLYGILPYGMVLYQNGKGTYFDWPPLMPRRVLPQMMYYDFDDNGAKDLAVILLVNSGSNVHVMDLHILTIEEAANDWSKPAYTEHILASDNVSEWMTETIATTLAGDGKSFSMDFCGSSYTVDCYNDLESGSFTGVYYGNIVYFMFEGNRIKTRIALSATYENYSVPEVFGDIEAYVVFDGENFSLEEWAFALE